MAFRYLLLLIVLFVPFRLANSQGTPPYIDTEGSEFLELTGVFPAAFAVSDPMPGEGTGNPMIRIARPPIESSQTGGVDWKGVLLQSATFLAVEQGFRLALQPGTREALKGEFFDEWFKSVKSTNGWGDGDDFLTNYIGHPMMGSATGYIFVQNDSKGRSQVFNWESSYWNSRLKATAWSALYSTQFELGPISEASLGNVGYQGKSLSGYVDLVITPVAGLGWQVGEDVLDRYLITRIENWTSNTWILIIARSILNPTRAFANAMRMKLPWTRETRPGILQLR